jgi:hypothetical protein
VSSATQSVLGHSPTITFRVDVVDELLTEFREQAEWRSCLEKSSKRICNQILGPPSSRV